MAASASCGGLDARVASGGAGLLGDPLRLIELLLQLQPRCLSLVDQGLELAEYVVAQPLPRARRVEVLAVLASQGVDVLTRHRQLPHEQNVVDDPTGIEQPAGAGQLLDLGSNLLQGGVGRLQDDRTRYGQSVRLPRLQLQHAAAVGPADQLAAQERGAAQAGQG